MTPEHAREGMLELLARVEGTVETTELLAVVVRVAEREYRNLASADLPVPAVQDRITGHLLPALNDEGLIAYDVADGSVALDEPNDRLDDPTTDSAATD